MINDRDADHWRTRDLDVLWHPCTQMREHPHALPLLPVARGEGPWLIGHDGRRTLDAVSSWWTNIHGHAEPRIADAIGRQARTLEQVILAGFSHAPAVELAERLLEVAPRQPGRAPLAKVFYADNGSAGVEVALKSMRSSGPFGLSDLGSRTTAFGFRITSSSVLIAVAPGGRSGNVRLP